MNLTHGAAAGRAERVNHLHRFHDDQQAPRLDASSARDSDARHQAGERRDEVAGIGARGRFAGRDLSFTVDHLEASMTETSGDPNRVVAEVDPTSVKRAVDLET